jgi:hypothetical protein
MMTPKARSIIVIPIALAMPNGWWLIESSLVPRRTIVAAVVMLCPATIPALIVPCVWVAIIVAVVMASESNSRQNEHRQTRHRG